MSQKSEFVRLDDFLTSSTQVLYKKSTHHEFITFRYLLEVPFNQLPSGVPCRGHDRHLNVAVNNGSPDATVTV